MKMMSTIWAAHSMGQGTRTRPGSGRVRRQEIVGIKEGKGRIAADAEGEQDKEGAAEQQDTLSSQVVLNQVQ